MASKPMALTKAGMLAETLPPKERRKYWVTGSLIVSGTLAAYGMVGGWRGVMRRGGEEIGGRGEEGVSQGCWPPGVGGLVGV